MPDNLVHYSEYRSVEAKEFIEDGRGYPGAPQEGTECSTNLEAYNWNRQHYKGAAGVCPFCNIHIQSRINEGRGTPMKICVAYPVKLCYVIIYAKKSKN